MSFYVIWLWIILMMCFNFCMEMFKELEVFS